MKKYLLLLVSFGILSCSGSGSSSGTDVEDVYTPVQVSLEIPQLFEERILPPIIPNNNPLTEEGIALGKKLFFDRRLSRDNTQSCASCHNPSQAFSDTTPFSFGVDGNPGTRNAMPLFNLAWNFDNRFNWGGSEFGLEDQAFEPVTNPVEMHSNWNQVANKLQQDAQYPTLFLQAFGTSDIDSTLVVKAIAQFERTLISGNSKFDRYQLGLVDLTPQELNGFDVYLREDKGDCFHCHGTGANPLWTDNDFHNNGLDAVFTDLGLGAVTGDPNDNAKFRTPSLRNLIFTAPYMHDGRFATLDEVIDFYSFGLQDSPTIDPLMKNIAQGGVQLSPEDKADLIAFLLTLTDDEFVNNPAFQE
jgi:cytochrome c peroxidase